MYQFHVMLKIVYIFRLSPWSTSQHFIKLFCNIIYSIIVFYIVYVLGINY